MEELVDMARRGVDKLDQEIAHFMFVILGTRQVHQPPHLLIREAPAMRALAIPGLWDTLA